MGDMKLVCIMSFNVHIQCFKFNVKIWFQSDYQKYPSVGKSGLCSAWCYSSSLNLG